MQALSIGAAGMASAAAQFDASALRVASGTSDLASEIAGQATDRTQFDASAKVMKVASQMTNALLDITV